MIAAHEPALERSEAAALGEEALATLADEPRLFENPAFLAELHVDLKNRLDQQCAAATLIQVGFFHGLRDASRLLHQSAHEKPGTTVPTQMKIPLRLVPHRPHAARDTCEFQGNWPAAFEAEALRALPLVSEFPRCLVSVGYTSGWLSGLHETEILALETECCVCEGERCHFIARKVDAWQRLADPRAAQILDWLDFEMLRESVARSLAQSTAHAPSLLSGHTPTVHVWGPVMVLPFSGGEESVRAVDLIGSSSEAKQVRVIVLDCAGTLLDDGFGAVAIQRILAAAEACGAECILSGLSTPSQRAVAKLASNDLLIYPDLKQAVRTAFQITNFKSHAI